MMKAIISGFPQAVAADVSRFLALVLPEAARVAIVEPAGLAGALATVDTLICQPHPDIIAQVEDAAADHPDRLLIWLRPADGLSPLPNWPRTQVIALPCHVSQIADALNRMTAGLLPINGQWQLDVARAALVPRGDTQPVITLTEKEAALLAALIQAAPEPVPRETLLADIWQYQEGVDTHTLETHIYRLRSKLADMADVRIINNDDGYCFQH